MTGSKDVRNAIMEAHQRFTRAIDGRDAATLASEPAIGAWTVRDVAAHLTDWIDAQRLAVEAAINGGPAPDTVADGEAFNLASAAQRANTPWSRVQAELDAAVTRAAELAGRLSLEQLDQAATYPWDEPGTVRGQFEGIVAHHDEHSAQLEEGR